MPKNIYRVVWSNHNFSTREFDKIEDAEAHRRYYKEGCLDNKAMSEESREYWKEQSKHLEIYLYQEKFIGVVEAKD